MLPQYKKQVVTDWWESWYRTVLPTLVSSYKWLQRHRNVQVGDVCLIRYAKEKRATYRLGRVSEIKKGVDGLVRKVTLKYKLPTEKVFRTVDRPIQGIAVIVPIEEQNQSEDKNTQEKANEPSEESTRKEVAAVSRREEEEADAINVNKFNSPLDPNASVFCPSTCKTRVTTSDM